MAIAERALAKTASSLRTRQAAIFAVEDTDWIDTYSTAPALGTVLPADFANRFLPQPQTLAVRVNNTAGGGTRTFTVTLHGKRRGRAVSEQLSASAGASAAAITQGVVVFDIVESYIVDVATGFTAGDVWEVGLTNDANTWWGLPIDVAELADVLCGQIVNMGAGSTAAIALQSATIDLERMAIKISGGVTDGRLVVLTVRSSLD